jgi:hypothetical protein
LPRAAYTIANAHEAVVDVRIEEVVSSPFGLAQPYGVNQVDRHIGRIVEPLVLGTDLRVHQR